MCSYIGVLTQLRKINVMKILQNSSFYGYIIYIVSKERVKKHKCHENTSKGLSSGVYDLGVSF